ncbi:MAG TPA: M48 family metallopeptidase [Solirubrobacteraceae bacterium]|jgi:Zn-dependent protease with chaperone function|nr:M48 family metallopeptidase [Solirubrobacteraceae bacterium]
MTDSLPEAVEPFPDISSKAYEHPADRAATAALKAVPMLDTVVRKLVEFSYERALRQSYLGNSIKVSERQLPELWASCEWVRRILDMPGEYDLYVSSSVLWNAVTIGSKAPMIVVGSNLLEQLSAGEQRTVIAHEMGHILSDHVLYITALNILLGATAGGLPMIGLPIRAVRAVLLEWRRAAELSCDRAATLAVRDPRIVCRTLMVLASGLPADRLDLDAFMSQAMEYENWEDSHDRIRRFFNEINATHTYAVRRVSEVMRWVQSGEYDRIIRGEYRRRSDPINVRDEAGDAAEFYAERFREMFREVGDNVTSLGSQVGDVSQQISNWLRNRGSQSG